MSGTVPFPGSISVAENLRLGGTIEPPKAKVNILAVAALQAFPIPLTSFRVFDNMAALLPSAGADDDLGIIEGTHGTDTPSLQADDHDSEGSAQSNSARVLVQLPWDYVAGNAVTLRFMAGMITTIASTTATLDCLVFKQQDDPDDAIGSDLYTGAAKSINAMVAVNTDFSLTATALSPGDILDVKITTAVDDTGTGTPVIAAISWAHLLCDVR